LYFRNYYFALIDSITFDNMMGTWVFMKLCCANQQCDYGFSCTWFKVTDVFIMDRVFSIVGLPRS